MRWSTPLTGEDYVAREQWSAATPAGCPWHPEGGCGFKRHGTYRRVWPRGCLIARYYCPATGRTVSLLPDCLAARRTGSLERIEAEVLGVERAASRAAAAALQRPDIELPGALRWLDRACRQVRAGLAAVRAIAPEPFANAALSIDGFGAVLGDTAGQHGVLRTLRAIVPDALGHVPAPLGFDPGRTPVNGSRSVGQHDAGADPPGRFGKARALIPTSTDPPHDPSQP